jgi:hypothetical protein
MASGRHSKHEVREGLAYAESKGWTIHPGGSHRWGIIWCPAHEHHFTIHSTPKNAGNHKNQIIRAVDRDHCEPKPKEA